MNRPFKTMKTNPPMSVGLMALVILGATGAAIGAPAPQGPVADGYDGPYYGDGNLPTGCTTDFLGSTSTPHFVDDCYHMRTDLNALDSATIDVLLVPPVSPYPERDLRVMRQSIEMWDAGIHYLAPEMGLDWLADGVEINVFPAHPDDDQSTDPLWFPKIVVVSTNPVGGAGIGIDPLDFVFGTSGPCHGQPNPLASFSTWQQIPGFENHHGGVSGTYTAQCDEGGSVCFAVNGAIDPLPGYLNVFGLYDLVSHEVGHCLSIGHVGDALDHTADTVPYADIMAYADVAHDKCVSTLDVESFALRMSEFLLNEPLEANDADGPTRGKFQVQHPDDHYYASSTGRPEDCPQPDAGIVPGDRVDFTPEHGGN